ncbi:MAG: terpene cyclase/mutase family protein [Deltaproteobacteria bacterium]|nr:terpene cyclase/mutase family protein [Deltaproteobacteria bacterium]
MNRKFKIVALFVAACFLALAGSAMAATEQKVAQAMHGGQQYLRDKQELAGSWFDDEQWNRESATAFAVAALLETGVPASDPAIIKGIQYMVANAGWNGTYTILGGGGNYNHSSTLIALSLWALASNPAPITMTNIIRSARDFTVANQYLADNTYKGSWDYNGYGSGDTSNTQFAVMGLWYANRYLGESSSVTDTAWAQNLLTYLTAIHYITDVANNYGVFRYYPGSNSFIGGPMTAAGLWSLAMIGQDQDPMALRAEEWFAAPGTYTWAVTPGPYYNGGTGSYYYFMFGMAKALQATVGHQNTLGTPARPWAQDFINEVVDNKAIWTPASSMPDEITRVHWGDGYRSLDGGDILSTAWMLMSLAFIDPSVEKKDALLPDPPDADFPIRGLLTLSVKGNATISRAARRKIGPEKSAQTVTLPIGATEFIINKVPVGGTTILYIKVPDEALNPNNANSFIDANGNLKPGLNWFKIRNGAWKGQANIPIIIDRASKEIQVTLRDGGPEDDDGLANGKITDPGAPGFGVDGDVAADGDQTHSSSGLCFISSIFSL